MKIKKYAPAFKYFKLPRLSIYFGPLKYGIPYFYPIGFVSTIIKIRKLKLLSLEEREEKNKRFPWKKEENTFSNFPIVRRSKNYIFKLFNNYYFLQVGWPFKIGSVPLGWKDKFSSPRFEFPPMFYIFFFGLQLVITLKAPLGNPYKYWEQILWFLYYADKDIKKAKETWPWVDMDKNQSSWDDKYLLK